MKKIIPGIKAAVRRMKHFAQKKRREITFVVTVILFICYEQGMVLSYNGSFHPLLALIYYAIDIPFVFIVSERIMPVLAISPNRLLKITASIIVAFGCYVIAQNLTSLLMLWHNTNTFSLQSFQPDFKRPLWRCIYLSGIAIAYYFGKDGPRKARQAKELEIANLKLKNSFLRSQLKPHFIFNTLQSIYGEVMDLSPKAAEKIALFVEVLQYVRDNEDEDGTVTEELEQVRNFIALNTFRSDRQLYLDTIIDSDESGEQAVIPPLFLVNIIENMFVHGNLYEKQYPGLISIICRAGSLEVNTSNLKNNSGRPRTTGFGLAYIRSQLNHLYAGRHSLHVYEDESYYRLKLLMVL